MEIIVDSRTVTLATDPKQALYDALRTCVDKLYSALSLLASYLDDWTIDTSITITLLSGVSFVVAVKTGGTWTIPDFRLPARSLKGKKWTISIPGFTWKFYVNFPVLQWIDLVLPKIGNPQLTDADLKWRNFSTGAIEQGSTIGRYYLLSDAVIDATGCVVVALMIKGLNSLGMHELSEKTTKLLTSAGNYKTSLSLKSLDTKLSNVKTETDKTPDIKTQVDKIPTVINDIAGVAAKAIDIKNKVDDIYTEVEPIQNPDLEPIDNKIDDVIAKLNIMDGRAYRYT